MDFTIQLLLGVLLAAITIIVGSIVHIRGRIDNLADEHHKGLLGVEERLGEFRERVKAAETRTEMTAQDMTLVKTVLIDGSQEEG